MTTTNTKPYRMSRLKGCGDGGIELLVRRGLGFERIASAPHDTEGARLSLGAMVDAANAAPALLASLRALVDAIDFEGPNGSIRFNPETPFELDSLRNARAALAAAEGRS